MIKIMMRISVILLAPILSHADFTNENLVKINDFAKDLSGTYANAKGTYTTYSEESDGPHFRYTSFKCENLELDFSFDEKKQLLQVTAQIPADPIPGSKQDRGFYVLSGVWREGSGIVDKEAGLGTPQTSVLGIEELSPLSLQTTTTSEVKYSIFDFSGNSGRYKKDENKLILEKKPDGKLKRIFLRVKETSGPRFFETLLGANEVSGSTTSSIDCKVE